MRTSLPLLLSLVLLGSLAPRAGAAAPGAPVVRNAAPERELLSSVPADRPGGATGGRSETRVTVRALVSRWGLVDSAVAASGTPALRAAAEASVRWWIFRPGPALKWTTVQVAFPAADPDETPPHPDRIALAREAEARGDARGALDAWTGALTRIGRNASSRNEWAIRERVLRLARGMSTPPAPPHFIDVNARGLHGQQERTVTTADHAGIVESFAEALNGAPWWPEPYLWCAASQLGSGQLAGALRNLRAYRLGVRDSAGLALANRALDGIAAGDTLRVCELLKQAGQAHRPDDSQD